MTENKDLVQVNQEETISKILESESSFAPSTDIYETKDEFVLVANLPGVARDNIAVKMEQGSLMIFGKVNYKDLSSRKYLLNENELGNYFRKFRISDSIDETKIEAKFENGQLTIKLPKHDRVKPKIININ